MKSSPDQRVVKASASRQRVVAGARKHFFALGFRHVTMDDLAAELGMSKKTLYAHFTSKTELVSAVMSDKIERLMKDLAAVVTGGGASFADSLHNLLATLQRHTEEVSPAFIRDVRRDAPEVFHLLEERRSALIEQHFGLLLREGRKMGMVRKDIPVKLIIAILVGATEAIMNPRRIMELGLTPRSGFMGIISVVLTGCLTTEGQSRL